ncbi:Aste57867_11023 [Aphanomyces stellatus]|uniref:Aste57867_11023 protein n=1 Tax=Aphanomyces stellatus TaxID=120398 RepID=A0A485KSA7_9STRA|nr:hypothetical protein As57867_010982 [Aphanomyces stellatus]VFT87891.1 Aste57867_11023 [Aphanomyces stellatus]
MSKWRSDEAVKESLQDESRTVIDYKGQKGRAAHERKLLKKDTLVPDVVSTMATLQRGILSEAKFSAANVQPTRLQLTSTSLDDVSFAYASGRQVLEAHVALGLSEDEQTKVTLGTQGLNISNIVAMKPLMASPVVANTVHAAEIQSIASKGSHLIASVDAKGATVLYTKSDQIVRHDNKKQRVAETTTCHELSGATTPELSWAGVAFDPHSTQLATVHSFSRALALYDTTTLQRTHVQTTLLHPTALAYSTSSTVVVAEYNQMSVWDAKSHARIAREGLPSLGCIHSVAWSPDGNSIAIGGEDKIAYIYDTRKWKLRSLWRCPLKYDLAYLAFSPSDPTLCYVAGLDNELMCGKYDGSEQKKKKEEQAKEYSPSILQMNHRLGFRGDSRWIGLDVAGANGDDMAVGICESGSAYAIRPAQHMVG